MRGIRQTERALVCIDCGKIRWSHANNTPSRCEPCAAKRQREQSRDWAIKHSKSKHTYPCTATCIDCGAEIVATHHQMKRCRPCQAESERQRNNAYARKWAKEHPEYAKKAWGDYHKKHGLSADEILVCYLEHPGTFHKFTGGRDDLRISL